jgi:hypothetical protein
MNNHTKGCANSFQSYILYINSLSACVRPSNATVPRFNPPAEPADRRIRKTGFGPDSRIRKDGIPYQTGFLLLQKLAGNFTKRQ